METLTETEQVALAAGGLLGGLFGFALTFGLIFYILTVIASWKIFTKAGEAGWKSLIPIYNMYILCRIIKINFWYVIIIPAVVIGILGSILGQGNPVYGFLYFAYALFVDIFTSIKLGNAFKKSGGFIAGLILLPNIFQLILAFDSSSYAFKKSDK